MRRLGIGLGLGLGLRLPNLVYPGGGGVSIVNNGVLAPFVTFTRASTGPYYDSAGVMRMAAIDEPRVDYDPATLELRGLLVEEQRTNLLLRSQEFDNASWTKYQTTVTANAATAPDGTATANKLVDTAVNDAHQCSQAPVLADNTSYTLTVYAKAAERSILRLAPTTKDGSTGTTYFNLATGALGSVGSGHVASMQAVGNGWYRCAITYNSGSGAASTIVRIGMTTIDGSSSYAGDGTSGLLLWGAQLEASAFATSYIPTAGTTVTRAVDVPVVSDLANIGYNFAEGAFYAEGTNAAGTTVNSQSYVGVSDNTSNNFIVLRRLSSDRAEFNVRNAGVIQASIVTTNGASPNGAAFKMASAYKANDFASAYGGALTGTDSDGAVPTVIALQIGHLIANTAQNWLNGHIRNLRYYPRRLSNAQLQALTA